MLQNLLTPHHKRHLKREYLMRLATVALMLISVACAVGIISLVPLYVMVSSELSNTSSVLTSRSGDKIENDLLTNEVMQTSAHLVVLEENLLKEKLTTLISDTLVVRPDGVTVVAYSYDRGGRRLLIEGVASTRELVAPYARNIEDNPLFTEVPIPISDLAKHSNLTFKFSAILKGEK